MIKLNGHSMVEPLKTVLVCPPENAGWGDPGRAAKWQELGFLHAPDFATAQAQHEEMCGKLREAGAEVTVLPAHPALTLDAVYAHDVVFPTDHGVIVLNPGKPNRGVESGYQALFLKTSGAPMLRGLEVPGTAEAGDMVWLEPKKLLIGLGFRTNPDGIRQIHQMLVGFGIEIIAAPLPYGAGPGACLHLMSLMSMLDEKTVLVDRPWMAVKTVQLLERRGFRLIDIEPTERETMACNVLALGEGRLLAIAENLKTNEKLRAAGFDVRTFPGMELCVNGGGGPTCLTRALWRG
jgi:N-dimethylarginine dimethylaminohydrolase